MTRCRPVNQLASRLEGPIDVLHTRVMAGTGGGPEKTIVRSPRRLAGHGLTSAAAYIHPADDTGVDAVGALAQAQDCPLIGIGERGPLDPRTLAALASLCRTRRVRLWHGHDYKSNLIGLMLRRLWPMKLVNTVHLWTEETARLKLYRKVDEWVLPKYDHTIAVSRALRRRCLEVGVPRRRLCHIANAIEADLFTRKRNPREARQALGLDPDAVWLGAVGRLSVQKGLDLFLPAMRPLFQARPNLRLLLVGDGPEREPLRAQAASLGLAERVRFAGWQTDLRPWYEALDALVMPSRREGLPNSGLEAMAYGVPLAATAVGGLGDLLDRGAAGVLLDDEPNAWPAQLRSLIDDPGERQRLGVVGRRRIEARFSFEARMRRVAGVYDRLLGRATPPGQHRRDADAVGSVHGRSRRRAA